MNNKLISFFSIVLFTYGFSLQLINAQQLSIKWGIEQPYHKRGQTSLIDIIKSNDQFIFYKVCSTKEKYNEFIIKHNRNTGENKVYDIINNRLYID